MRRALLLASVVLTACSEAPGASGLPGLEILSPMPDAQFYRDSLDDKGARVAAVPVEVDVAGDIAKVVLSFDSAQLGELDADGKATATLRTTGLVTLTATALDVDDGPLATASVDIHVDEPTVADCHAWLDLYKVTYTVGPMNPGVADPVTVTMPINGMPYRSSGAVRTKMFGDCALIKSLAEAAPLWKARDVVEVTDLGVYNYRCIGNTGTPPNCPNGISEHAYGNAIDLAAWKDSAGTTYTVKTDFVIDPAPGKTCTAPTEPGKDTWLHQVACELKQTGLFNIVLTPNYNADHRDHFHVDRTQGSDFID